MANEDYNYSFIEEQELDDILAAQAESAESCRTRAIRRRQRELHIERKEKFLKKRRQDNMPAAVDGTDLFHFSAFGTHMSRIKNNINRYGACTPSIEYKSRGYLAKGKIHCSCPMCRFAGTTQQDRKSIEKMLSDAEECNEVAASDINRLHAAASF